MKAYHKILFSFIMAVLFIGFTQGTFSIFKIRDLKGDINTSPNVSFSIKNIFDTNFQHKKEKYFNHHFGFRNDAIRLRNQIYFSFFNKAKAKDVVIGKDYYLYEENYIKAYFGLDFTHEDSIKNRLTKLKFVQKALEKKGKTIMFIIAPGKGSFYPEYFPEKYHATRKGKTNYQFYARYLNELNIKSIDFNRYFLDHKKTSTHLLYPKYGIHWSHYGSCIAADSIVRFIEKERKIDMPNLTWQKVAIENAHGIDIDIAKGMNLLFDSKWEKMGYPIIDFEKENNKTKPKLVVIGDSFHWTLIEIGLLNSFANFNYWFYNSEVYHSKFEKPTPMNKINFNQQINNNDVFIILCTEANLPNAGWCFIEQAYQQLKTQ